jgi:hypothetical protein
MVGQKEEVMKKHLFKVTYYNGEVQHFTVTAPTPAEAMNIADRIPELKKLNATIEYVKEI